MTKLRRSPICRFNFNQNMLPVNKILMQLFEELHVYNKNNIDYNHQIDKACNQCLQQLDSQTNLLQVFKNNNTLYALSLISNIHPNIKQIKLFIGINESFRSFDTDAFNVVSNNADLQPYTNNVLPLAIGDSPNIDLCSIIITIGKGYSNKNKLIGMIKHELLHIIHDIIATNIAQNAGDAYFCVNQLEKKHFITGFPTYKLLTSYYNETVLLYKEILTIFCAGIYYLDSSEFSAHLESYNMENLEDTKWNNDISKIYLSLLTCLTKHKLDLYHVFDEIKNNMDNPKYKLLYSILNTYFKSRYNTDILEANIITLIKFWRKRCHAFLKKAKAIHKNNHP